MGSINSDEIISVLREEIENFDKMSRDSEVGTVIAVGDGIARIYGIDHAMYGEIVTLRTGLKVWYRISARMRSDVSSLGVIPGSARAQRCPEQEREPVCR